MKPFDLDRCMIQLIFFFNPRHRSKGSSHVGFDQAKSNVVLCAFLEGTCLHTWSTAIRRENSRFQWFGLCPMQVDSDEACLQRYATVLLKIIHIYIKETYDI